MEQQGVIKQQWQKRGFTFGIWQDPPGQIWKDYVHNQDELFMLVEGNVELTLNNQKIIPKIGEEILIPAGTVHTVKNNGNTQTTWYYGYLNGS